MALGCPTPSSFGLSEPFSLSSLSAATAAIRGHPRFLLVCHFLASQTRPAVRLSEILHFSAMFEGELRQAMTTFDVEFLGDVLTWVLRFGHIACNT
jgi:hypothetical protein